ncbi:hypothetical protein [Pseudoroseicyclus sp. CXY001]|uniref:hypothetical protein n=1 Tax=Pseudoroseicyclus sp. CXY001 TaxID=3242492 RepID=UPI003570B665
MTRLFSPLLLLALLPACTLAEGEVTAPAGEALAVLSARSPSVAPSYAWSYDVTLAASAVTARYCHGYETEGPACGTASEPLGPEAGAALEARIAAFAADLTAAPIAESLDPPIGGGATAAVLYPGSSALTVPGYPADTARAEAILAGLEALIPAGLVEAAAAAGEAPAE